MLNANRGLRAMSLISLSLLAACEGGLNLGIFGGGGESSSGATNETLIIIVAIAAIAVVIVAVSRRSG